MNVEEVGAVLAKAAAYDQRRVGPADVLAWHEVLSDVDVRDALQAVSRHYAESPDRIMPAHIRRITRAIREERRRAIGHEVRALPGRFEDDAVRDLRIKAGLAACADVLGPVLARLAARRRRTGENYTVTADRPTTEGET